MVCIVMIAMTNGAPNCSRNAPMSTVNHGVCDRPSNTATNISKSSRVPNTMLDAESCNCALTIIFHLVECVIEFAIL